jgi:hypothetical protein
MSALLSVLVIVAVLAIAFLLYVASKSPKFRIARTATINAPAARVFAEINDLRRFNVWNPFAGSDPTTVIDYNGLASGVGAAYAWTSSGRAGTGRMAVTQSTPNAEVGMRLEFEKPFVATNTILFTIVPNGDASDVTWAMTGHSPFMHRLMGTLFGMDKMVGGEFAKGLANLKAVAEKS